MSDLPESISVREVGPRDGLQNEDPVPTEAKVELIDALSKTGVGRIEAVSFVHPRAIPQMADADEVWSRVHRNEDVLYYVIEGEHVYQCGDEEFQVGPGDLVFLPRGIPHAHRRVVPQAGRLIGMTFPGGLEGFFRILAEASRVGDLGEAAYARASHEYGITWVH